MSTVTLQLDPVGFALLRDEAAELGIPVDVLATDIIRRHVKAKTHPAAAEATAFRQALADSVNENEELLRRLAR